MCHDYDSNYPLILDPEIEFASYVGSSTNAYAMASTYGENGTLIVGGIVFDIGYPESNPMWSDRRNVIDSVRGITDVVISKFSPAGNALIFSTYYGGGTSTGGSETVHAMVVEQTPNIPSSYTIYFMGATSSNDIANNPMFIGTSTFQGGDSIYIDDVLFKEGTDIYVTALRGNGTAINASVYRGGTANDGLNYYHNFSRSATIYDSLNIAYGSVFKGDIDLIDGSVLIISHTKSLDFPLVNPIQQVYGGNQDAVVVRYTGSNMSGPVFSTYLGGNNLDAGFSIKYNSLYDNIIVGGSTYSNNLAPKSILTNSHHGKSDGFIANFSNIGNNLQSVRYVGTSEIDVLTHIDTHDDDVYAIGMSNGNFPVSTGVYTNPRSGIFLARYDLLLTQQTLSTVVGNRSNVLLGNSSNKANFYPTAFSVDTCENVYFAGFGPVNRVVGLASSLFPLNNMPISEDAYQTELDHTGYDFYFGSLDKDFSELSYGSYFGGDVSRERIEGGIGKIDNKGGIYHAISAGCGANSDFTERFVQNGGISYAFFNNSPNCDIGGVKFSIDLSPKIILDTNIRLIGCAPFSTVLNVKTIRTDSVYWVYNDSIISTNNLVTYTFPEGVHMVEIIARNICGLEAKDTVEIFSYNARINLFNSIVCEDDLLYFKLLDSAYSNIDFSVIWSYDRNQTDLVIRDTSVYKLPYSLIDDSKRVLYANFSVSTLCSFTDSIELPYYEEKTIYCEDDSISVYSSFFDVFFNEIPKQMTDILVLSEFQDDTLLFSYSDDNGCVYVLNKNIDVVNKADLLNFRLLDRVNFEGEGNVLVKPSFYTEDAFYFYSISSYGVLDTIPILSSNPFQIVIDKSKSNIIFYKRKDDCFVKLTESLIFNPCSDDDFLFIPNTFTPNGDNVNDYFLVYGIDAYVEGSYELVVLDRFGSILYSTDNQQEGWDGKLNGQAVPSDIYTYQFYYECIYGKKGTRTGTVYLIR